MLPLVSVIVPIYNNALYLKKCIEKLLRQTYSSIEIILIDDGSLDESYQIAKAFESKKCMVVQQQNAGAAVARNTGLKIATGRYIQFMDADDFISDDKIEQQVRALAGAEDKVAVCNYVEFSDDSELTDDLKPTNQSSFIFSSNNTPDFLLNLWIGNNDLNFIQTNCWLVPRALIEKAGHWRQYRCPDDDGEFFTRVLLSASAVVYVPGIYNFYRRGIAGINLSKSAGKKHLQNNLLTISLKHDYISAHTQNKIVQKAIAKQYLDYAVFTYPLHKILSAIAYKRYTMLNEKVPLPQLGGNMIELVKFIFGWRTARLIKHYLRGG